MKQVFIHGLGQAPASWEETLSCLGAGEERVCPSLVELLRGREADYKNLYGGFCDFCSGLGGPVDLCGLSLGGVLALDYAAGHPENVRSMVLIGAQYKMPRGLLYVQNALFRLMPGAVFRQAGLAKEDLIRLCGSMLDLDLSGLLPRIACPVLVLCGEKDRANRKASLELAGLLESAGLQVIPKAGHEVNAEAPAALAEILRAFYGGLG